MFKRSFLSLMLIASLACPAVQAGTWTESVQSNLSGLSGAVSTRAGATKDFALDMFSRGSYTKAFDAIKNAYSQQNGGFKAAGQALVENKSAVAGVALGLAALAATGYVVYNKWFAQKTAQ